MKYLKIVGSLVGFLLFAASVYLVLIYLAVGDVYAATQGTPGRTSTAVSKITLIIRPLGEESASYLPLYGFSEPIVDITEHFDVSNNTLIRRYEPI